MQDFRFLREIENRVSIQLGLPLATGRFRLLFSQRDNLILVKQVLFLKEQKSISREISLREIPEVQICKIIESGEFLTSLLWVPDFKGLLDNYLDIHKIEVKNIESFKISLKYLRPAIEEFYLENGRILPLLVQGVS